MAKSPTRLRRYIVVNAAFDTVIEEAYHKNRAALAAMKGLPVKQVVENGDVPSSRLAVRDKNGNPEIYASPVPPPPAPVPHPHKDRIIELRLKCRNDPANVTGAEFAELVDKADIGKDIAGE